jgi:hypothetical protein
MLLAQSPAPTADNPNQDSTSSPGTLTGRVLGAADGDPLKSARVWLVPEHSHTRNQFYSTSSDSEGRFFLQEIPPAVIDSSRRVLVSWNSITKLEPTMTVRSFPFGLARRLATFCFVSSQLP